jgi:hypothetical protein
VIVSAVEYDRAERELKAILQQKKIFQQHRNLLHYAALHRAESLSGTSALALCLSHPPPLSLPIYPSSSLFQSLSLSLSPSLTCSSQLSWSIATVSFFSRLVLKQYSSLAPYYSQASCITVTTSQSLKCQSLNTSPRQRKRSR